MELSKTDALVHARQSSIRVLVLDSASTELAAGICDVSFESVELAASLHLPLSETLGPLSAGSNAAALSCVLAELALAAGSRMKDIQRWVFGRGPASNAWTEASRSLLRGLAANTRRPLFELSSLEAMALEACESNLPLGAIVVPLLPTDRPDKIQAGAYAAAGSPAENLRPILPDSVFSTAALKTAIARAQRSSPHPKFMGPSLALRPIWHGIGAEYFKLSAELREVLSPIDPERALPVFETSLSTLALTALRRAEKNDWKASS